MRGRVSIKSVSLALPGKAEIKPAVAERNNSFAIYVRGCHSPQSLRKGVEGEGSGGMDSVHQRDKGRITSRGWDRKVNGSRILDNDYIIIIFGNLS